MTSRLDQLYAWRARRIQAMLIPAEKIEETVDTGIGDTELQACDVTLEPVVAGLAETIYLLRKRVEIFNASMTCDKVRIRGGGDVEASYSTFVADPITAARVFIIRNAAPRPFLFFENVRGAQELVFELDSTQLLCSPKLTFHDTETVVIKPAFRDSKLADIKQMLRGLTFVKEVHIDAPGFSGKIKDFLQ